MKQNHLYLEVLWKSEEKLSGGSFNTYRWKSSCQQPLSLTETFWELESKQRFSTFLESMKLKLFFKGLTVTEFQCLADAPGFFEDRLFLDLMRALAGAPSSSRDDRRKFLLQKLQRLQLMLAKPIWNLNLLYTYQGVLDYRLQHCRVPIGKVNKFSGWIRSLSASGSKSNSPKQDFEPEIEELLMYDEIDFYSYLCSPTIAFDDLGIPTGTLLYPLLKGAHDRGTEIPESLKKYFK